MWQPWLAVAIALVCSHGLGVLGASSLGFADVDVDADVGAEKVLGSARPPPPPTLTFAFDAPFGSWMVLQRAPARSAVYGFMPLSASTVKVLIVDSATGHTVASVPAAVNATQQAFGPGWGERPCPKDACPPYDMSSFTPFGVPLPTWKAVLPAMEAGGDYEILAVCSGCDAAGNNTLLLTNVTFGDVFFASGQSNMWLPVLYTFSRNQSAAAIMSGAYSNLRLMAGSSGDVPYSKWPPQYGASGGSNPWLTAAAAAPAGCIEKQDCPLFNLGGTAWYNPAPPPLLRCYRTLLVRHYWGRLLW